MDTSRKIHIKFQISTILERGLTPGFSRASSKESKRTLVVPERTLGCYGHNGCHQDIWRKLHINFQISTFMESGLTSMGGGDIHLIQIYQVCNLHKSNCLRNLWFLNGKMSNWNLFCHLYLRRWCTLWPIYSTLEARSSLEWKMMVTTILFCWI